MKHHSYYQNLLITLFVSLLTLCLAPAVLAQTYTITDLGSLARVGSDDSDVSAGRGINQSGQVTGNSFVSEANIHAFLYSGGVMTDIGTLGGTDSDGWGINASGQVAGYAYTSNAVHAFLYSRGVMTDLGTLGGNNSWGFAINDSGEVTGQSIMTDNITEHAFLYSGGTMRDLGTLGGKFSFGRGINASGQVTGQAFTKTAARAFLYSGGVMRDLGTLGGANSAGMGINASGQVTGKSDTTASIANPNTDYGHAFLYSGGKMTDLGTLGGTFSQGIGINSSGQIVGSSGLTANSGSSHAFLYSPATGMVDLNTLLPANSGWTLGEATAINDAGQITGVGGNPEGNSHAFLLSPAFKADLAVRVNGAKAVRFGGNLHYVVVVQNKGPQAAHNVIVTDTLPAGARVEHLPPVCHLGNNGHAFTCKLGTMAAESGRTIHFMLADVTFANVGSRFSDTARVSGDVRDPNTANNTATRTSVIK